MTANKEPQTDINPDFVLKHRITGAAFLIFFGILILPWLLGAPSQANKEIVNSISQNGDELTPDQIEQELLTVVDNAELEDVEVYVSKITPLDRIQSSEPEQPKAQETKPVAKDETTSEAPLKEPEAPKPQVVEVSEPEEIKETEVTVDEAPVVVNQEPAPIPAVIAENEVKVGWVVQVGVFTDRNGAEKVIDDLETRGFTPSTTIVDTNQGKASATRVWLGPYAQRVDAAKSMSTLKEKTGSDGFIRAYP